MSGPFANPLLARPSRPLPKCIAVVGCGTIGPDIAYYLKTALPGVKLYLVDVAQKAVDKAIQRFSDYAQKALDRGAMNEQQAKAVTENLIGTLDYSAIHDADWVLEAATENIDLKRKIFAQIESIVRPDTLITSNTSSLPAKDIFRDLKEKKRATVTHFFAPAWRNPVVEVIRWEHGDPAVLDYLRWVLCATGKIPVVTADVASFMLDRIFTNWCNEAALLLDKASAPQIDSVAEEFVHAGPFFVLNLTRGNPIMLETNNLQADLEGEHYRPAELFKSVASWNTITPGKPVPVGPEAASAVRDRLLGILFSQSVDIIDRNIGDTADLELTCRLALGFKKGPLDLMRDLGDATADQAFRRLAVERPGMPQPKLTLPAYQDFLRHVLVDDVNGVKVITLHRPEALNAVHDEMTEEILGLLRTYEKDPKVKGFVIVGYGNRSFCAGFDIGRFPRVLGNSSASLDYAHECSRLLAHIDKMKKPVVAALNGMTFGGGLELALRCHGIVAQKKVKLQFPEITLGIVPGMGGLVVPYRRWPQAAATFHNMLRKAEQITSDKAHELGVIDGLYDDYAELVQAAVARAEVLNGKALAIADGPVAIAAPAPIEAVAANGQRLSAEVIGIMEAAIRDAANARSLADALEVSYRAFAQSACTAAAKEGISAFLERRKPDFSKTA